MSEAEGSPGTVLVVQHVEVEGLGAFGPLLDDRGLGVEVVAPDVPLPPSALDRAAGIIVLGGPMGVYETDRHPRLLDELWLLEGALKRRTPILGVCLGSQLLATVLGTRVAPGPAREIGWLEVALEPAAQADRLFTGAPERFHPLHWHGDVFELPRGARHLARSAQTTCQAFAYDDRAWGLLFHLEAGLDEVRAWSSVFADEVRAAGTTAQALLRGAEQHAEATRALGREIFARWLDLAVDRSAGGPSAR